MSLRVRLVATTLALFTIGLAIAGGTTYGFLRSFLLKRVDQELFSVRADVEGALLAQARQSGIAAGPGPFGRFPRGDRGGIAVPFGTYAELRDPTGQKLAAISFGRNQDDTAPSHPVIPATVPVGTDGSPAPFTTSVDHHTSQHFRALGEQIGDGLTVIVAIPMSDADQTLRRLIAVELTVAAGVLAAIAATSLFLIRRGLRPLDRMGETAGAIAAGDLSQRVEVSGDRTEIGRLGDALNAMLAQIELSFAERQATEARLRQFVADASHELRTPLTSIRGWAELFRRGAASRPDDLARAMTRIEDESTRMTSLIEGMLALARLDEGLPLGHERVDLASLAVDSVDDARVVEPGRPITLDSSGDTVVVGDGARLQQVLANLLSNARQHTPPATPVHVDVSRRDADVVLTVRDEGPGMTDDEAARIFERFYRADPSRAVSTGGAGLGLSIVAAIATAHGGTAAVRTSLGSGSTFSITLPAAEPELTASPQEARSGWAAPPPASDELPSSPR